MKTTTSYSSKKTVLPIDEEDLKRSTLTRAEYAAMNRKFAQLLYDLEKTGILEEPKAAYSK